MNSLTFFFDIVSGHVLTKNLVKTAGNLLQMLLVRFCGVIIREN